MPVPAQRWNWTHNSTRFRCPFAAEMNEGKEKTQWRWQRDTEQGHFPLIIKAGITQPAWVISKGGCEINWNLSLGKRFLTPTKNGSYCEVMKEKKKILWQEFRLHCDWSDLAAAARAIGSFKVLKKKIDVIKCLFKK